MQETRQHILEILRERGQATVDDIVADLRKRRGKITAVTVRHHLMRLQEEDLITSPEMRRRSTPGRPQHIYSLTDKAQEHFPNNYQRLVAGLLTQIQRALPPDGVNVILEGVAQEMASEVEIPDDLPIPERLRVAVQYLNDHGYEACWAKEEAGYVLKTSNCPYHHVTLASNGSLCTMDMHLVAALVGSIPRRIEHMTEGDHTCAYLIEQAL